MNQNITTPLKSEQDRFQPEELFEMLKSVRLERGQYVLDVSPDGSLKFSRIKKYWINKPDIQQAMNNPSVTLS